MEYVRLNAEYDFIKKRAFLNSNDGGKKGNLKDKSKTSKAKTLNTI
jgi:hypothetical protein